MLLPGGLLTQAFEDDLNVHQVKSLSAGDQHGWSANLRQQFRFVRMSGALEMSLFELLQQSHDKGLSHPAWIGEFLFRTISFDHEMVTSSRDVHRLCIADRQYLVLQWRLQHGESVQWLTESCKACDARFDVSVDWSQLPIKSAGPSFPFATVKTSLGDCLVRVPNGEDQVWLAEHASMSFTDIRKAFAMRLILKVDQCRLKALTIDDVDRIESAVEAVAPECADHINTNCPDCGEPKSVALDFYSGLAQSINTLLDDVHRLALNYHWGEDVILQLPTRRRKAYLSRLDRDRGMREMYA